MLFVFYRASRGVRGYQGSKENQDHRESWEREALLEHLDLQAPRVFLVTWDHRERTALKDQRESWGSEVYRGHEECLARRETRARSDHRAQQDWRVEWAEKDFPGRLGQRESRVKPVLQGWSEPWENEVWWVSSDLWERQDWQERRVIEERWAILDLLEKKDHWVTQGHQGGAGQPGHQEDQALLDQGGRPVPEDPKAYGER